jgi:hypothetical protein
MAKRLAGTEIWDKDWFLDLTDKQKLLVKFLFDNCDCAGFYEISWRVIRMSFTSEITIEDFKNLKQIKFVNDNTIFIEDFISFQYGIKDHKDLNPNNRVHKGVINRLKKYNCFQTLNKPFDNSYLTVQEKEKDKDKDKDKDNILSSFGTFLLSKEQEEINQVEVIREKQVDPYTDPLIDECLKIYSENCPDLCKLRFERKNRVIRELTAQVLTEIDRDIGTFKELCQKANNLKTIVDKPIDYKKMLNCYQGILNGAYQEREEKSPQELFLERMRREEQC